MKKDYWLISVIIILALFLRFYHLTSADVITDEALIAFRAIGYLDFFASPYQTTPYEWFSDNLPFWAKLSFHDHPPLVFLIQHLFFSLFGQSLLVLRLPFALAGVGAVLLIYLIGRKLFEPKVGLSAALLLSVSVNHNWVSRIGLQESLVIFFSLLTFYLFLKNLAANQHWQWGISLGLAMLTKYTAFIVLPIFLIYSFFTNKIQLKKKSFWLGLVLAILIFSPVLIYNLKLYQVTNHFDLQFSYLFGQTVPEWQYLPGKMQMGSFFDRLISLIPNLFFSLLLPMFIFSFASIFFAFYYFKKHHDRRLGFLLLTIFSYLLLFLLIGPLPRFLSLVVPFIVLMVAWFISQQKRIIAVTFLLILAIFELFFTVNTLFAYNSLGWENVTYSQLKKESYSYGYNQLDAHLTQLLKNKKPAVTFTARYQFLEDIKKKAMAGAEKEKLKSASILLIYDGNMYDLATLWLFHRRMVYQGWPIITADDYLKENQKFWTEQGISDFYFFEIIDSNVLQKPIAESTNGAATLAEQLKDIKPDIIKRPDGQKAFAVYHW